MKRIPYFGAIILALAGAGCGGSHTASEANGATAAGAHACPPGHCEQMRECGEAKCMENGRHIDSRCPMMKS